MNKIMINKIEYEIIKDDHDSFDLEKVVEKYTDYFEPYDYILGDYAYDKLRLKGFTEKGNPRHNKINSIETLDSYLKEYCAYGAKYFLLKKVQ